MQKISIVSGCAFLSIFCIGVFVYFFFPFARKGPVQTITPLSTIIEKPLERYTIENLSRTVFQPNPVIFDEPIATTSAFIVRSFLFESNGKKITGLAHIPITDTVNAKFPVIVQLRGFVDRSIYVPGVGTKRSAEVFASHGFLSLAPDFLGYGGSDMPSKNVFEERFETYTAVLTLLSSIPTIATADTSRVGIWGHSNGGQIALTILAVTGKPYPATLWAPVTKPFPYNILYYTDEFEDKGKLLQKELAVFEKDYDVDYYSFTQYIDRINAPLQIHQGIRDESVPIVWSDTFVKTLHSKQMDIRYYTYPQADHNIQGANSWNTAVHLDISFFRQHFQ